MTAAEETMLRAPRERAGRAVLRPRDRQVAGRHERRPHLVAAAEEPVRSARTGHGPRTAQAAATRAARSARSRHAARAGWVERARRLAGQAQAWWAEGIERLAARAGERGARGATGRRAPTPAVAATPAAAAAPGADVGPARATGGRLAPAGPPVRAGEPTPRHLAAVGRRASWGEDLVTGWCSLVLVVGLYLDGAPGPWRGVLLLGLAVTAGWILTREQLQGAWSLRAVPAGYRLGLVGVGLAMVAVAGDAVWHALFGAEQGLARLAAPFHLVLLAGTGLLVSSALRAAWAGPSPARVPSLKGFWPVVLSTTLIVATTAFFLQDVPPPAEPEVAETVLHNLLFIAPVLLLLLRWQPPLGTFTVMAGSVAVALVARTGLGLVGLAGAAVLGGTAADVAVAFLRPSPQRRWAARAVAVIAPAVYWTAWFALGRVGYGIGWEPALGIGAVLWGGLSGFALALLMWPPAVPLTAWNRGRNRAPSTTTPTAMPARMVGR